MASRPQRPPVSLRTRHFDVAADEPLPVTFTYRGETYRCRGEMPALPVLRGMRAQLGGGLEDEAARRLGMEFLEAMFEPGELDRILRTGISLEKLMNIAGRVMELLTGEGEAEPPATGAADSENSEISSTAGDGSRPTSSASTASTSGESSEPA